jgi:molybdopterin biosynthesis enzyme
LNKHGLVMPVLRRLARLPGPGWTRRTARLAGSVGPPTPRFATVVPLQVRGDRVTSTFRGSSTISSLGRAETFAILPPGHAPVRPASRLSRFVLDPLLGPFGSV